MLIGGDNGTSEYRLMEEDKEGDLDITVEEDERNKQGRPLIDWVKSVAWRLPSSEVYEDWEEDEEVDCIDLYASGDEGGNGSEDSDDV